MARILVVDDSPTERYMIRLILEKHGHTVTEAENGEMAIERARVEKPDLVLMDIVMPGRLNGFQATRRLSKNAETASIPVIIVSVKGQETDRLWAFRQGAKDYMSKPVVELELMEKINAMLER